MTDDKKSPIEHTLDVFVYLPLGFVLELPSSIPRCIDRGRRELSPRRLLSRGGRNGLPTLADAGERLTRLQEQTQSTLRALGVTAPSMGGAPSTPGNGHRPPNGRSARTAPNPAAGPAAEPTTAPGTTPGAETAANAVADTAAPAAPPHPAPDPSSLAITDYDSLSASQVVPRLDSLAVDELEGIRVYEVATRGRKTILNKIAQLQSA